MKIRTIVAVGLILPSVAMADSAPDALMLRFPDVGRDQIVFIYANDVWLAPVTGGTATLLASPPGGELFPKFSPDGANLAFVGNYDGNRDLYVLPIAGGEAVRVTHHPAGEVLCDWTPDGQLLFFSNGLAGLQRQSQLFQVAPTGGLPKQLPVPYGAMAAISPDATWLAYTPHTTDFRTWKRYRGGMATDIWLFNLKTNEARLATDWEGTDTLPMWNGQTLYYLSDEGAEHRLNIWRYDLASGNRTQVTALSEYDVKWPSIGPGPKGTGMIVFQYGSSLMTLDVTTGGVSEVEITIPGDRPRLRPQLVDASKTSRDWDLSPTGVRAVVEARGDIWTVPAEHGSPRNLTHSDGVYERYPAWSPDGRWIAYFSDESGEYELYVTQSDGKEAPRRLTTAPAGDPIPFRFEPTWSPDSKNLVFSDKSGAIYLHTLEGDVTRKIDQDPWANRSAFVSWSSDSRWITYERSLDGVPRAAIFLYRIGDEKPTQVTSGMFNDSQPVFDRKGEYIYYKSNRSFAPDYEDFGTTFIYTDSEQLIVTPLRADLPSPFAPKSDEVTWKKDDPAAASTKPDTAPETQPADPLSGTWTGSATDQGTNTSLEVTFELTMTADRSVTGSIRAVIGVVTITSGSFDPESGKLSCKGMDPQKIEVTVEATLEGSTLKGEVHWQGQVATFTVTRSPSSTSQPDSATKEPPKEVKIDLDGFEHRSIILPVESGAFFHLAVNDANHLVFGRQGARQSNVAAGIKIFDPSDEKKEEKLISSAQNFVMSADGKKLLLLGGAPKIINASAGASAKDVPFSDLLVSVDPKDEWRQIVTDAWRLMRDYFYDPNMHGVDWKGMLKRYGDLVDHCASRDDVGYVISEMISELNVGHAYYNHPTFESQPSLGVGLLGADFELGPAGEDGTAVAYRISRILEGGPWDLDARGPLSQPGIKVKVGDYLLAVNGVKLDTAKDPWAAFVGQVGRAITLTVSDKPVLDGDARDVVVEPLDSEANLRFRAWIEHNRKYVEEKTGGRVGYIYVPDTGVNGQNNLVRQFQSQIDRDALIIDERWNGGGQIPTRFIELLNRPVTNYWARRDGNDWRWPPDSHQGPKCMLINGLAGSGGDAFPHYFRQAGLGKLIGMRTWGGLVGITGNPPLMDGASISVPVFAFYENDGTWGIEGHGVDPDLKVVDDPSKMVAGGDPQLDVAIGLMLDEITAHPYRPPARPAYPDRRGMGIAPQDQ